MTAPNTGTPNAVATTTDPATNAVAAKPAEETDDQKKSKSALALELLPEDVRHGLILNRQKNMVSAAIAEANWGKGLDRDTRFRVAEWSQSAGIDPATELDVLGGKFYKNAQYYLRKQSEMIEAGYIEYVIVDHVEVSAALERRAKRNDEVGRDAQREVDRREMVRIDFNIPEKAESAVVWRVKLRGVDVEFSAAKWCGGGTRKKDPVGDDFPVETSETRAARRCLRLIASQNPQFKPMVEPNDDDQIDAQIGGTLREGLAKVKAAKTPANDRALASSAPKALAAPAAGDYGGELSDTPAAEAVPVARQDAAPTSAAPAGTPVATVPAPAPVAAPAAADPARTIVDDDIDENELWLLSPQERAEYDERQRLKNQAK